MPKMKSHSGMGKRTKVTGGGKGKVTRQRAGASAGATYASSPIKPSRQKRRLAGRVEVSKADTKRIKKLLGR